MRQQFLSCQIAHQLHVLPQQKDTVFANVLRPAPVINADQAQILRKRYFFMLKDLKQRKQGRSHQRDHDRSAIKLAHYARQLSCQPVIIMTLNLNIMIGQPRLAGCQLKALDPGMLARSFGKSRADRDHIGIALFAQLPSQSIAGIEVGAGYLAHCQRLVIDFPVNQNQRRLIAQN